MIHTPWVALSVVSSVDPAFNTVKQKLIAQPSVFRIQGPTFVVGQIWIGEGPYIVVDEALGKWCEIVFWIRA